MNIDAAKIAEWKQHSIACTSLIVKSPGPCNCHAGIRIPLLDEIERLQAEVCHANAKWIDCEQRYILPLFNFAEDRGFDLRQAVKDNAGKTCAVIFAEQAAAEIERLQAERDEYERKWIGATKDYARLGERLGSEIERLRRVEQAVRHIADTLRDSSVPEQRILRRLESALAQRQNTEAKAD